VFASNFVVIWKIKREDAAGKNDKTKTVCVCVKENVIGKVMTLELLYPHFFAYICFTYKRDDLF
jgi:hypothetical protein